MHSIKYIIATVATALAVVAVMRGYLAIDVAVNWPY